MMKFARCATMAVAALLLVQVAAAIETTHTHMYQPPAKPTISACHPATTEKPTVAATCPTGYTLDHEANQCYKHAGYSCKVGKLAVDSKGKAVCKFCKPWQTMAADGKCVKECKKGFVSSLIQGHKFCVESCPKGFHTQGNDCISDKKVYTLKKCSDKLCLPKFKLYFVNATAPKASGRRLSNAVHVPKCVCALTTERSIYQQEIEDPMHKDAHANVLTCPPTCPAHAGKPHNGKCTLPCPTTCEEKKGKCVYGCPAGYTTCKKLFGGKYCVKGSGYGAGHDLCKEAKLAKKGMCPIPVAPKPSPAAKPSAAPKTVVVVDHKTGSGVVTASAVATSG